MEMFWHFVLTKQKIKNIKNLTFYRLVRNVSYRMLLESFWKPSFIIALGTFNRKHRCIVDLHFLCVLITMIVIHFSQVFSLSTCYLPKFSTNFSIISLNFCNFFLIFVFLCSKDFFITCRIFHPSWILNPSSILYVIKIPQDFYGGFRKRSRMIR